MKGLVALGRIALSLALMSSLVLVAHAESAFAQSADLDRVEELTRLGRVEEARAVLAAWWEGPRTGAPARELQRGLWLRGRLTVDPLQADLDYQRILVLYPSSPYAPQALLRLAQAAHARGEASVAANHVAALVRDYPASPSRVQAEAWLAAAGPAPAAAIAAVAAGPGASTAAPSQAATGRGGAAPAPAAPPTPAPSQAARDTVAAIRPSTGRPPAPADERLDWFVQFGAFSDEDRAFDLQRRLVAAGLAARLVRVQGSGFLHVRLGRFPTRDDANRQLQDVTRRGFTAAIVHDERAEEVVRR
jgi:cell division protein FtsN